MFLERHENDTTKPWFQTKEQGFNYSIDQTTYL